MTKARDNASQGGLVLVTSTTFTTASAVNVNNCFTSSYQNYKIMVYVDPSDDVFFDLRFRASGTDNTGNNYRYFMPNSAYDGSGTSNLNSGANTYMRIGTSSTSTLPSTFIMDCFGPELSQNTYLIYSHAGQARSGAGGGTFNTTTQFDGFSILPSSGTVTGNLKVYGYKD